MNNCNTSSSIFFQNHQNHYICSLRKMTSMFKKLLTVLLIGLSFSSLAVELEAKLNYENPTNKINDGVAVVEVKGGVAPYKYRWSHQWVDINSNKSTGITEGSSFTVLVTDANGNKQMLKGEVPTNSIEEVMNSTFKPIVETMTDFLFWDPFSAVGIYDPVVDRKSVV